MEKHFFQGQCAYSDQAQREGCQAKDFFSFTCPNNPEQLNAHPRYPDPTGKISQIVLGMEQSEMIIFYSYLSIFEARSIFLMHQGQ